MLKSKPENEKSLSTFLVKELLKITQYINLRIAEYNKQLPTKSKDKMGLVNQLSQYIGDGSEKEKTVKRQVKQSRQKV